MATQTVFQRYEKKYLLSQAQFAVLHIRLLAHMCPDEYGRHTICSLYFDTEDDACAAKQIEKTAFREKLRLRSYGVPRPDTTVYLELKKKFDGITHKRRMGLSLAEAIRYLDTGAPPANTGQVFGEIDWFVQQYSPVPKSVICYDRVALYGKNNAALRVTFDENIRYRAHSLNLAAGDTGRPLCAPGQVLMELKIPGAMPLWLAALLSEEGIFPVAFSKFRTVHEVLAGQQVTPSVVSRLAEYPMESAHKEVLRHA